MSDDQTTFPHLYERLQSTFGDHIPAEIQASADEITVDGVITVQEWAEFLDFMHEYTLRHGAVTREGQAVYIDLPALPQP